MIIPLRDLFPLGWLGWNLGWARFVGPVVARPGCFCPVGSHAAVIPRCPVFAACYFPPVPLSASSFWNCLPLSFASTIVYIAHPNERCQMARCRCGWMPGWLDDWMAGWLNNQKSLLVRPRCLGGMPDSVSLDPAPVNTHSCIIKKAHNWTPNECG